MPTNVIINGDFSSSTNGSAAGWSGTDIETRPSNVYISGSGNSRVAEMNGGNSQITVMEQTFTLTDPATTELTLDFALRDSATAGVDGFRVEILDAGGTVLATQDVLPTVNSVYQALSLPVTFPSAGDYTVRFTELGDNADGSGAVIDNVELLVCFSGDTGILTPKGTRLASELTVGDLVETESGPKPLKWIGRRIVTAKEMEHDSRLAPVRICKGALGGGLPSRDLLVSRQHRVLVHSRIAARMFGHVNVLVSAIRLTQMPGIFLDDTVGDIEYIHLLLDTHEVLFAENAPAESLYLGDQTYGAMTPEARDEIELIFPDLRSKLQHSLPAYPIPSLKRQRHFIKRVSQNRRMVRERLMAS